MSKTKVTMTATQIADKWGQNLTNSVANIQAGIDAVTESPMEKAAANQDKMLQNLTKSVQNGTWAKRLRETPLANWKQVTKTKVATNLASGVQNAMEKRRKFDDYLVTTLNQVLPEINSMPSMTLEDSVNRVRKLMTHMANNPYKTA